MIIFGGGEVDSKDVADTDTEDADVDADTKDAADTDPVVPDLLFSIAVLSARFGTS